VVFADEVDTAEEAGNRIECSGCDFTYSQYDVTTNNDRALLMLQKNNDGDLYQAAIYGRPIVLDLNRSCFIRDENEVAAYGTAALNITGSYFSEYQVSKKSGIGIAHYEDWVIRELAERLQQKREFTLKTHRALFHARVGAKVKIAMSNRINDAEQLAGTINALSLRYKRDEAFVSSFRIVEGS
jgi:hypothetical protein